MLTNNSCHTVWKFHDFSITQILREIKIEDSRSAKSAIFINLEALNFDFHAFLHFLKYEIDQKFKIQSLKNCKNGNFEHLECPKLISRKILMIQKSEIFTLCVSCLFTIVKGTVLQI